MKRTHNCEELREGDIGKDVVLQGWVNTRRDHGGVVFIDMRDRYGLTQVVFYPDQKAMFSIAEKLRREDCIEVHGKIVARKDGMKNPNMVTGDVEMTAEEVIILNKADVAPIEVDDRKVASEEMRQKYRYLDLRRPAMQKNFVVRHKAAMATRKYFSEQGFLEIETPLFVKPTPEGARDYIVPSRLHPGKFYSLPQSPQLYKQLLMVSGFDRYFQLARCCRDEDGRTDRQMEFTQIDVEMSFPTLEDIYTLGEGAMQAVLKESIGVDVKTPFPRISYDDSMDRYGSDKPDIRFELFLNDISDIAKESDFEVFKKVVENGGMVKAIAPHMNFSRNEIDKYTQLVQQLGAKGLAWMKVGNDGCEGGSSKFFSAELHKKLIERTGAVPGSTIFFIADSFKNTNDYLSRLRLQIGGDLKLFNPNDFAFCWIIDFRLFEWSEDEEKWDAMHHLFCMPKEEDMKYLETDPGKVHATQYDMVLNGSEICSGSIRIHNPEIQERVMKVIGLSVDELKNKFGFLLDAFKYGAPPHGGFAFGFDRIVALMCGTADIKEVIAFPKSKSAESLMDGSPNEVTSQQLKELHIKLDVVKKDKE